MSDSSFSSFRESSSLPVAPSPKRPAREPSETPCPRLYLPRLCPRPPPPLSFTTPPLERPADGSLRSDFSSPISISGRSLHRGRGAIPREPSSGKHSSQAILGPAGVIQDVFLDNTDKGREAFSKIKGLMRKTEARSRKALVEAMGKALDAVTARDARRFFEHCGYCALGQLFWSVL